MKQWKQITTYCMAAALAAAGPAQAAWAASPEFARTAQEWAGLRDNVMEYEELAGLIHEYNTTVQNNNLDFNKQREDPSKDDIAQAYRDQADDLRSSMSGESAAADATAEAQAARLEQQADENVFDIQVYRYNYDQTEANLVVVAQSNLISYHQKLLKLEAEEKNRETLEAVYQAAVAKKSVGMATQMDVLSAQEELQNADASILETKADIRKLKQTLCVMLGWQYNADPEIRDIPSADMARIDQMNPSEDVSKAIDNNFTLKGNKRKLENASSEFNKTTLQNTIKDNEQKIGASLEANYQAVLQAKISYDQAVAEYNLETQNMANAEAKFQVGSISRLEYLQQQNAHLSKKVAVRTADMNLFQAMETYDWSINGLASTQ